MVHILVQILSSFDRALLYRLSYKLFIVNLVGKYIVDVYKAVIDFLIVLVLMNVIKVLLVIKYNTGFGITVYFVCEVRISSSISS